MWILVRVEHTLVYNDFFAVITVTVKVSRYIQKKFTSVLFYERHSTISNGN
jgi:hypothetical protein